MEGSGNDPVVFVREGNAEVIVLGKISIGRVSKSWMSRNILASQMGGKLPTLSGSVPNYHTIKSHRPQMTDS